MMGCDIEHNISDDDKLQAEQGYRGDFAGIEQWNDEKPGDLRSQSKAVVEILLGQNRETTEESTI